MKLCEKNYLLAMEWSGAHRRHIEAVKSFFLITTTVEGNKAEICHTNSGALKALLRNHRLIQFQSAGRDESETAEEIWYTAAERSLSSLWIQISHFLAFEYKFLCQQNFSREAPHSRVFQQSFRE